MQNRSRCSSCRGAVRAGALAALLLALAGIAVGLPTSHASVTEQVPYTRLFERMIRPQVTDVRTLVRRIGAINRGQASRPIPLGLRDRVPGPAEPPQDLFGILPESVTPRSPGAPSPVLTTFNTIQDFGGEPPDDGLAVGPRHVVAAGNVSWGVYDKASGRQLFLIPFTTWYSGLDRTNLIFDPRVDYDPLTGRFYLVSIGLDDPAGVSTLQISVSASSDPLGTWFKYVFDVAESNPVAQWMDFPTFGFNDLAMFVGGNTFSFGNSPTFQHVTLRVFPKAQMLSGAAVTPTTVANLGGANFAFTVQPATTYDSTTTEWMVERGVNALNIWKIINPLAANPAISRTTVGVTPFGAPPGMAQSGNAAVLDGGDGRIANAILRNGELWTTVGVGNSTSGTNRGEVRVYQVAAAGNGSIIGSFTISDPALNFHYPSVDMDGSGAVMVGMTSASAAIFPSMSFAVKTPSDTLFGPTDFLVRGSASYTPKSSRNRWGDYSDTAFDPADSAVVWHQNELSLGGSRWTMTVGAVRTTPQSETILSPNGRETLLSGSAVTITWRNTGFATQGTVKLELSRDGGGVYSELIAASAPDTGQFPWTVTEPASSQCRIRVTSNQFATASDASDANFSIVTGSLRVTEPNGGELERLGTRIPIRWTATGFALTGSAKVNIDVSRDGGVSWSSLFSNVDNTGEQNWVVDGPETTQARVRVTAASITAFTDASDQDFEIREPSIVSVTSPNGGEKVVVGQPLPIAWQGTGFSGNVMIEMSRNGGQDWVTLFPDTPNDGSETWTVSGPPTKLGRVRVTALSEPAASDFGDGFFSIEQPGIRVTAPTAGRRALIGTSETISWTTTGVGGASKLKIELSRDGGGAWETISAAASNNGSTSWAVSGPATNAAVIRITSVDDPSVVGVSSTSAIAAPTLFVVTPNGGEKWILGDQQTIQWSGASVGSGTVDIDISRDNGRTWEHVATGTPNDGQQAWGVSGGVSVAATKKALIRITWNTARTVVDRSDRVFSINRPTRGHKRR